MIFNTRKMGIILSLISLLLNGSTYAASTGGVSFTPTSVKLPIWAISLSSSSSNASSGTLYSCSGSSDSDCYVDIASSSALSALATKASGASVTSGTYDTLNMSFCKSSSGNSDYTYLMEGSVKIGSTTYYTASQTNGYLTTNSANQDYVSISTAGCSQEFKFVTPITISSGSTASLSLFTTIVNMGWATDTTSGYTTINSVPAGYNSSSCANSGNNWVCSNAALVVPYFGTGTPTVQYYQFQDTTSGSGNGTGAQLMVLLDSSSTVIGAFPSRIFPGTDSATTISFGQSGGFDSQVKTISKNSDGSYVITSGSSSDTSNGFYLGSFNLLSAANDTAAGTGTVLSSSVSYTVTRTK